MTLGFVGLIGHYADDSESLIILVYKFYQLGIQQLHTSERLSYREFSSNLYPRNLQGPG